MKSTAAAHEFLRELLNLAPGEWRLIDNDAEYTKGVGDDLVERGLARSEGHSITVNGQWYPGTKYQITEEGLQELDREYCPNCEGEGLEDYNFETKTETPCSTCKGKGHVKIKPYDPFQEVKDKLAAVTAERDALQAQLGMVDVVAVVGQEAARYREALEAIEAQAIEKRLADDHDADTLDFLVYVESTANQALHPKEVK